MKCFPLGQGGLVRGLLSGYELLQHRQASVSLPTTWEQCEHHGRVTGVAQSLNYTDPELLPKRKAAPFSLRTSRFTSQAVAAGTGTAWSLDPAQRRRGMQEPSLLSGCL